MSGASGIGGVGGSGGVAGAAASAIAEAAIEGAGGATATAGVTQASAAAPSVATSPLEQLRAGEIDAARYVELQVEHATSSLEGALSRAHVEAIRAELRALIDDDPDVAALVQRAATAR
jgi:hypothetical protein